MTVNELFLLVLKLLEITFNKINLYTCHLDYGQSYFFELFKVFY